MNGDDNSVWDRWAVWLATGLGIGLVSPAPGTVGSLWGLPLAWGVLHLTSVAQQAIVALFLGLLAVAICSRASRHLVSDKDPQEIVLDEIVVLTIVYLGVGMPNWRVLLAGWLLFRICDITKPPPAQRAEGLPRGWGIMADDFVAALYACVLLHATLWIDRVSGWHVLL